MAIPDDNIAQQSNQETLSRDQQTNYLILMQQREEENRQEIAKLTAEIKALKVQLLQHRSKFFVFSSCAIAVAPAFHSLEFIRIFVNYKSKMFENIRKYSNIFLAKIRS